MNIAHQSTAIAPDLLARFIALVGQKYAVTDPAEQEKYLVEGRNLYRGTSPAILRPGSVAEVSATGWCLKYASVIASPTSFSRLWKPSQNSWSPDPMISAV